MRSPESALAAAFFRRTFGRAPIPPPRWTFKIEENDGRLPLYEVNRERKSIQLNFHPGQQATWASSRRFIFMLAGKQSGKTSFGPIWLLREILERGGGDYLAISATYDLFNLKLLPSLRQFLERDLQIARYWPGARIFEVADPQTGKVGARNGNEYELMWGRIILRSADSEEGLQSATAKAAWLDEAGLYRGDVYKDVRARLALTRGSLLGTTSIYDLGWLKQQIYDPWVRGDSEIDVIQFSSRISPFFSEEEYESLRRAISPWQFRMDYDAEFGRPPAAIYEDFIDADRDHGGHKCKRFLIPREWPRMVAVDPGIINPGKLWAANDPETDTYYIYRAEKGGERRTSKEHAQDDVALARADGRVIWWAVGAKSEKYWREDYRNAGAEGVREPDTMDVQEGLDRGALLLRQHRVFIFDDLVDFIDEMLRYSREIKNGKVTDEIKDKATFHLMDAYRYFAVQVVKPRRFTLITDF